MRLNIFKQAKKTAIITGATGGLGQTLVSFLLKEHYTIIMIARNMAQMEQISLRFGNKVIARVCNIANLHEIEYLCEDIRQNSSPIDLLVHCAGNIYPGLFEDQTDAMIESQIQVNLAAPIFLTKGLIPAMRKKSSIIFINSLGGIFPLKRSAVYSASKFGLRGFALSLAMELHPKKIYVSSIFPGAINTSMLHNEMKNGGSLLNFCAPPLATETVCHTVLKAIKQKRLEYFLPQFSGVQVKFLMNFPALIPKFMPFMEKIGEKRKKTWHEKESNL